MIRDDMRATREKAKLLAAKEKARKPSVAQPAVKAKVAKAQEAGWRRKPKRVLPQKLVSPRQSKCPEAA